jgi:hypothetical protein
MLAPLSAGTIEHRAVRVLVQDLTFEDAAILECEVKNISWRRVGHRVESDDGHGLVEFLQRIAHAAEVAMTIMQTPHTSKRLTLRQLPHTLNT